MLVLPIVTFTDVIDRWIDEAYAIFKDTSVYEVIDLDEQEAVEILNTILEDPDIEDIERYLGGGGKVAVKIHGT